MILFHRNRCKAAATPDQSRIIASIETIGKSLVLVGEDMQVRPFFHGLPLSVEVNSRVRWRDVVSLGTTSDSRNTNDYGSSRSTYGKSDNRRGAAAGDENDDYDALFGSDDETFDHRRREDDQNKLNLAFPRVTPSSNATSLDPARRVDWTKMRRTDTSNDMTKWKDFPPVIKEFYAELPDIAEMPDEDVQALRAEKNNIVVSWFDPSAKSDYEEKNQCRLTIPNPIYEFAHAFHNYPEIMNEIAKQRFTEPSPIQCQAWPVGLSGQDFIGIAQVLIGSAQC